MIINGDALEVLKTIKSESVDTCITSPPYYKLRNYGVQGQIGLENTHNEYINKLVDICSEIKRVLKHDGTLWLNIADTYKNKNLLLIPYRLALASQNDGWYVRQDIIWYKPNCMPESANDRCTKAHEYLFLLSKSPKYYFDYKAIMEPCVSNNNQLPAGSKGTLGQANSRRRAKGNNKTFRGGGVYTNNRAFNNSADKEKSSIGNKPNTSGLRRKRDVWSIATSGYKDAHFATFPLELARTCILAGSREGETVLDPFGGSGTVGEAANELGRNYILIDINKEYCELMKKRCNNGEINIQS